MRIGHLRKVTGFCKSLRFTGNVCKMRAALVKYLTEEGIACKIADGVVFFTFDEKTYTAEFRLDDDYPECEIYYEVEDEDYKNFELYDKTYVSAKVNGDMENHCIVYTFNDCMVVSTSYYFNSKQMMLDLFGKHFCDMTESLDLTLKIISKKKKRNEHKERRIGFTIDHHKQPEQNSDNIQIVAKA